MNDLVRQRLPIDLRQAARVMAEVGNTFPTGQAIMAEAADEIERLREWQSDARVFHNGIDDGIAFLRRQSKGESSALKFLADEGQRCDKKEG